jgi:hypothetical protein
MRFCVVRDLVTHALHERELAAVFEFGDEFAFSAKKYMALDAPMVSHIAGRVLNRANA